MIDVTDQLPAVYPALVALGSSLVKQAGSGTPAYNLVGLLQVTQLTGEPWGILTVPNALLRGVFDAMQEPGLELPFDSEGRLTAHISVFRPEEIAQLGGPDALKNDRGKPFRYTLGRLVALEPEGWKDVAKCFVIRVHSPELQALRRSLGLSSLPHNGEWDYHITVGVVRKGVTGRNAQAKATAAA